MSILLWHGRRLVSNRIKSTNEHKWRCSAAAQAACADVAALKDVLLRPPDPVPVVEREASVSKPRRGFAAWLNEIVDAELES